jgi:hypothetical protein
MIRWLLILYGAALCLLAPHLTLWLDEVLTLVGARQPDLSSLVGYVNTFAGSTPLTFLPPRWTMSLLGNSAFAGRLPSIIASVFSCWGVYRLAQRAKIASPVWAMIVFALWPLQFRYALEARPYALGLAFTIWATEALLQDRALLYWVLIVCAGFAQPYAVFIAGAHMVWSFLQKRSSIKLPAIAIVLAMLTLLPWYAYFREGWRNDIDSVQIGAWSWRVLLVFIREISGSGYIGAAILLAGMVLGMRKPIAVRPLWMLSAAIPVAAVLVSNAVFAFFFATRQTIYILPAVALLFTAGTLARGKWGCALLAAFIAASVYGDVRLFLRPHEDFESAAKAVVEQGACVSFVGDSMVEYTYFHPELRERRCAPDAARVVLAGSMFESKAKQTAAREALLQRGLHKRSERDFAGPFVEVYSR